MRNRLGNEWPHVQYFPTGKSASSFADWVLAMPKCLLYIPTNRECEAAIRAYTAEADRLAQISPSAAFALIESNEAGHTGQHRTLLANLSRERHVPMIHLDLPLQRHFVEEIVKRAALAESEQNWVVQRLLPLDSTTVQVQTRPHYWPLPWVRLLSTVVIPIRCLKPITGSLFFRLRSKVAYWADQ